VIDLGRGVKMYTRAEWGARPPRSRTPFTPTFGSTTHWEGPHMGTFPHAACAPKVRGIQAFHMDDPDRRWSDIAYTAITCPHGFAFQGRWIGVRTAANGTNVGNASAYAVCYMSGEQDPFTEAARTAQRAVLDYLDRNGGAGPSRNCHRDWKQTACPGDVICAWVRAGQPAPGPIPTPTPPPSGDDDVAAFAVVRCPGRTTRIITSYGQAFDVQGGDTDTGTAMKAALAHAGWRDDPDINFRDTDGVPAGTLYDIFFAGLAPNSRDLLMVADTIGKGFNVTKPSQPGRPNPGVYVADLAAIVQDNT